MAGADLYTRGTALSWRTCFRAGWELCREISYAVSASSHVLLARRGSFFRQHLVCTKHLARVDSKDSLLGANQIQGCFWGRGLGSDASFGVERRCLGADGTADHRPSGPEGLDRTR